MTVFQSFVLVSLLVPYDRPLFIRIFYGLGNEKAKYREYLLSPWICNPRGLRQGFTTPYNYLGSQTLTFKSIGLQIRLDGFCSGFLTIDSF